jgi:hypothetical protein
MLVIVLPCIPCHSNIPFWAMLNCRHLLPALSFVRIDQTPPSTVCAMPAQSRMAISRLSTVSEGIPIKADPSRDPELPTMYEVFDHPLWPRRRSMVFLADLTIEGQIKALEVESRQRIPAPGYKSAKNAGAKI